MLGEPFVLPTCNVCGKEIAFIRTTKGKKMPVDREQISIIAADGKMYSGWRPHFATCVENQIKEENE